jgi:hypothetical protein
VASSNQNSADGEATRWDASVLVDLYRGDDGRLLTYDLLQEKVEAEIEERGIPEESWRDGVWNFHDYLVESVMVGIYRSVQVEMLSETRYTNGTTVWTYEQMRNEVFPTQIDGRDREQFIGGELTFEDWLAESCNVGTYRKVDVVEYRDEGGNVFTDEALRATAAGSR